VTKPFSLRELLARVKANLRRVEMDRGASEQEVLRTDGLVVDMPGRRVEANGAPIALQPKEFELLAYLLRHPGTVMTRERLLNAVWGHGFVGERTVDVHIRRVRAKLADAGVPNLIRTVHGVGYSYEQSTGAA
jgi:DNA-binding response OmpR family regulator